MLELLTYGEDSKGGEGEGEGVVTCTLNSISRVTNSKGNTVKFMHHVLILSLIAHYV